MTDTKRVSLGANILKDERCSFLVWAPVVKELELHLVAPEDRKIKMSPVGDGYFQATVGNVRAGARYFYNVNGLERPDPASRFQPEGVHGPSEVIDSTFGWTDQNWFGIALSQYVIYELHTGSFTIEGNFEAIIPHLEELKELGITAIELMPVSQFPGNRNWGYDGVGLFAA